MLLLSYKINDLGKSSNEQPSMVEMQCNLHNLHGAISVYIKKIRNILLLS